MAKAKKNERGKVKLGLNELTDKTYCLVQLLTDVVSQCGTRMPITDLAEIVDAIKTECGDDAVVAVLIDDHFGNSVEIIWYRPETDEEWAKRLEANKKRAKTAVATRKATKKQKEIKERAELARLKKKYSKED